MDDKKVLFAWVIALISMLGSLYFSEVKGFKPCNLCWYQRIFMYPLVILLGIALLKKDEKIRIYTTPLAVIGFFIAAYQYIIQKSSFLQRHIEPCEIGESCVTLYINWLGFITIPFLSMAAFGVIVALLMTFNSENKK
ncbi:disulfide oxidoreductase [Bacillus anthracis]|uniref:disulfide oxidoreductase n=1 Tax=Bacillus anthracis TaxID=1392 RepID=UPI003D1913D4